MGIAEMSFEGKASVYAQAFINRRPQSVKVVNPACFPFDKTILEGIVPHMVLPFERKIKMDRLYLKWQLALQTLFPSFEEEYKLHS